MLRIFINEGTKDEYSCETMVCDTLLFEDNGVRPRPDYAVVPYTDIDRIESFDPETDPLGHYWTCYCVVRNDVAHSWRIDAHSEREALDSARKLLAEESEERREKMLECAVYYGGDDARPFSEAGFGIECFERLVFNW